MSVLKFENFAELEIRIGTVIEAERVSGTDKLIKTIIDMGDYKRQVVAGFGHIHSPEELIGKQVPVVLNIEPAMIRGVESNGIFVALDDVGATLLVPQSHVSNGTRLK